MKLSLLLFAAALMSCRSSSPGPEIGSNLSTVTVGKFQAKEGYKDWKSMKIMVNDAVTGASRFSKETRPEDYASGTNATEIKLKYGAYSFILEYYDADGKTVLYRSCKDKDGLDPRYTINSPKFELRIEVCATNAAGGNPADGGGAIGESDVTLTPVFRDGEGGNVKDPNGDGGHVADPNGDDGTIADPEDLLP